MEITRHQEGAVLELRVAGRLDAYWADHLHNELQEAIRGGAHQLQLDFSGVTFMSSAGLRVLLTGYQQLSAIQGSLTVIRPSPGVQQVLELAGFDELLVAEAAPPPAPGARRSALGGDDVGPPATVEPSTQHRAPGTSPQALDRETARYEIFPLAPGATLRCRLIGETPSGSSPLSALRSPLGVEPVGNPAVPFPTESGERRAESCDLIAFPDGTIGIGVGAPGRRWDECRERLGEFLAVAGSAAYLPTDGTNVPDYLASAGSFVPELQVLYGLQCEGTFALLSRFETQEEPGRVSLSQLAEACLEMAGSPAAGIVIVAQSAGLVGAALRRSPGKAVLGARCSVLGPDQSGSVPAEHRAPSTERRGGAASWLPRFPEIRQWLSFTPERAHTRSLVLLAGVAARGTGGSLGGVLRPLGGVGDLAGHFHAAAFSYRPLQRGALDLKTTVDTLFEAETLQGVLHLLNDDRPIAGAGESEFVRGACWISPIIDP
jgi:anti-anti-sigma factor